MRTRAKCYLPEKLGRDRSALGSYWGRSRRRPLPGAGRTPGSRKEGRRTAYTAERVQTAQAPWELVPVSGPKGPGASAAALPAAGPGLLGRFFRPVFVKNFGGNGAA